MSKESKSSLRDRLTATTNEGKIELAEEQLTRVTGGSLNQSPIFWKWDVFLKY